MFTDHKKLGTILESKVVQKLKFSKNDNKKPSSKLIFFNEKKFRKIPHPPKKEIDYKFKTTYISILKNDHQMLILF